MKASKLVARVQKLIAEHGDVNVYRGDMKALKKDDFDVVDTYVEPGTSGHDEREKYGEKYLHIGEW